MKLKVNILILTRKISNIWARMYRYIIGKFQSIYSPIIRSHMISKLMSNPYDSNSKELVTLLCERNPTVEYNALKIFEASCMFDPRFNALYTLDGDRINISALIRGKKDNYINAPDRCGYSLKEKEMDDFQVLERAIYGGLLFSTHYGHFITETLSRIWFIVNTLGSGKTIEIPILFRIAGPKWVEIEKIFDPAKIIFESLGIINNIIIVTKPVFVQNMIIPEAAIINNRKVNTSYISSLNKIGASVLQNNSTSDSWRSKKIYLSRSKLPEYTRKLAKEEELESRLNEFGYYIVHPEKMGFAEQIRMFSDANEIVGSIGSSFHTLPFSGHKNTVVKYLVEESPSITFNDIDGAIGINSSSIQCLYSHPLSLKQRSFKDKIIDLDRAINGIMYN